MIILYVKHKTGKFAAICAGESWSEREMQGSDRSRKRS